MEISIMHPLKQIRVAPRVRRLFTLLFACVLGHSSPAADITLTEAMLNDYHLGGGIVDFADSTIGWPPNDVPNTLSPGDTIYIEGHTRKFIRLINITQGTASDPITITNTGGQFILESPSPSDPVARGILLMGAQHVILKGTPDPGNYDYGIKIASTKAGSTGVKVSHNGETGEDFVGSFDVEITGIEIGNTGFAGIQIKSEIAEADLPEEGYIMDNIRIHNNYIHDTHGEGMYLGWTSAGHHDMSNIKVYNNLLVNTGWDGIQFNRCIEGGEIYNNTIYGYAHTSYTANEISQPYYWQNSGIGIGDSEVKVYNNWVQAINKWAGSALSIHTTRPLDIFNNVLVIGDFESDTPEDGIYITQNSTAESGAYLKLYNNTLIEPERCGVYINASVTVPMYFTNNIIANPILNSHILNTSSASLTTTTNLLTTSISAAGFVDASNDDYHLSSGSSAVDTGTDLTSEGIIDDIEGLSRPQGSDYDIGAFEREAEIVIEILTPNAWGTASGSNYCPATTAFSAQPTWDSVNLEPSGVDPVPHSNTLTFYANRYWYIDFGADYADIRITEMWTRYRPWSSGTHTGFATMWWDDDNDTVNDGSTATGLNFDTGTSLPSVGTQLWWQDADFNSSPVTPQGRYLIVSTGSAPGERCNEFAFVGYTVP